MAAGEISYYEAYNRRDFNAYDEIFADDVAFQSVGGVSGNGVDTVKFFDRIWVDRRERLDRRGHLPPR
jgi:hypothetical protein